MTNMDLQSAKPEQADSPITIRNGDALDIASIMPIMEAAFSGFYGESWNANQCLSMLSMPSAKLLLAETGHNTLGFAISRSVMDEEELLMIAVHPDHQGKRIGQALLQKLIEAAQENGVITVFLEVRANNNAQKLYQALGFEKIGMRKAYYTGETNEKFDAITYKKTL